MSQSSLQVSVGDFLHCKRVEHLHVLANLDALELLNRKLALVDSNEVDQFAVLLNVEVNLLNVGLIVEDIFLDGGFGFEETLQSSLTHRHLVQFSLLVALPLLCLLLHLDHFVTALGGIHHALYFEALSLQPNPNIFEGLLPAVDVGYNISWDIWVGWIGQQALRGILLRVKFNRIILKL